MINCLRNRKRLAWTLLLLLAVAAVAGALWRRGYHHIIEITRPYTRLAVLPVDVVMYSYADVAIMTHKDGTRVYVWRTIHAELSESWAVSMLTCPAEIEVRSDCVVINGTEYRADDGKRLDLRISEDGSVKQGAPIPDGVTIEPWMTLFYPDKWLEKQWSRLP